MLTWHIFVALLLNENRIFNFNFALNVRRLVFFSNVCALPLIISLLS